MRIAVLGTGYVGLVTGTCLADTGNQVVGIDIDAKKVATLQAGKLHHEPGRRNCRRRADLPLRGDAAGPRWRGRPEIPLGRG